VNKNLLLPPQPPDQRVRHSSHSSQQLLSKVSKFNLYAIYNAEERKNEQSTRKAPLKEYKDHAPRPVTSLLYAQRHRTHQLLKKRKESMQQFVQQQTHNEIGPERRKVLYNHIN